MTPQSIELYMHSYRNTAIRDSWAHLPTIDLPYLRPVLNTHETVRALLVRSGLGDYRPRLARRMVQP